MMRNSTTAGLALLAAGSLTAVLVAMPAPSVSASPSHRSSTAPIALKGAGYGSRMIGGQLPAGSHQTAYTAIGCGTKPGMKRENHEAEVALPGLGTISGVKTRLWTREVGGAVHSYSRNTTADVVLAQSGLGTLSITAISSLSHAFHDADGFHAHTQTSIGGIEFVPTGGEPQELDLPTPGQPVEVPGLAKISLGTKKQHTNDHAAIAEANALQITAFATGSKVTVAHSAAQALSGVKHGKFHGFSAGSRVSAADDAITSGRTPLSMMPCQGTDGVVTTKAIADVNLGDQIVVQGLRSQQKGKQLADRSTAFERGTIASIDIGNGALVVDGVIGQANVSRTAAGTTTSSTRGSTIGRITANGEPQILPDTGVLEIPGVAKIRPMVVDRSKFGISVVALRITLLDGTGAVIDLGVARAKIR